MVRYKKGHKNSKGEKAEWCIVSHKTGRVISSHKSKSAAEKHLGEIQMFKYMKNEAMNLNEAKQILKNNGFLVEDFEEDVARRRLNGLEGTFDIQGDEANFFDTGFPFAKIEHGRLMLYRPVSVESLLGENVTKLSIPYKWIDVTEYDEESWNKACNFVDAFRRGVDNFEIELQMNKAELEKRLKAINKYSKI